MATQMQLEVSLEVILAGIRIASSVLYSLRAADAFPVVASLPRTLRLVKQRKPKESIKTKRESENCFCIHVV